MDCLGQRALPHRAGICCTCGRTKRLCSVTASLGRRKNLCMVESMSSVEQRLRRVTNHKCDLCLCRDDAFDAQTTGCLILFKQALKGDGQFGGSGQGGKTQYRKSHPVPVAWSAGHL